MNRHTNKTRKMTYISILIAQALVLGFIERQIPLPAFLTGIPGAKIGLANIVTLIGIFTLSKRDVSFIVITRVLLSSILFSSISSFLYAISGGILSMIVMMLLYDRFKESISMMTISIIGAIFHNLGQLFMAFLVISNANIFAYLPYLILLAVPTSLLIGYVSKFLLDYLKRHRFIFAVEEK